MPSAEPIWDSNATNDAPFGEEPLGVAVDAGLVVEAGLDVETGAGDWPLEPPSKTLITVS